jgi:pimeloyl-ACP methyl ester carboxylesterase
MAAGAEGGPTPHPGTARWVQGAGVRLLVREYGEPGPDSPTVVLVHGFPDDQRMWHGVAARLVDAGLHVATYDVRGAGDSDAPRGPAGYRTELLVEDLASVVESVALRGARVHLVGHDWGSVQLWDAVAAEPGHPRLRGRVASFTSVSGPSLDHLGMLARSPAGRRGRLVRQLTRSWYVYFFHVPLLPELSWRLGHRAWARLATLSEPSADTDAWDGRLGHNGIHGVNLYRANVLRRLRRPRAITVHVPVLVVAPRRDPFLTEVVTEGLEDICSRVRVVRPDTGHWLPRTHPALLAGLVEEQVRSSS